MIKHLVGEQAGKLFDYLETLVVCQNSFTNSVHTFTYKGEIEAYNISMVVHNVHGLVKEYVFEVYDNQCNLVIGGRGEKDPSYQRVNGTTKISPWYEAFCIMTISREVMRWRLEGKW